MHNGVYMYLRVPLSKDTGDLSLANIYIDYNLFDGIGKVNDTGKAIVFDGADMTSWATNIKFRNNTVYNRYNTMDTAVGFKVFGTTGHWTNFYAQNNIISAPSSANNTAPAWCWSGGTGAALAGVYWQNNDSYQCGNSNNFLNSLPASSFTSSNNIATDPAFVSTSTSDFHLQASSGAKTAGLALGNPTLTDIEGKTIPISNPSMGCYQY